jgi:hypothetical protein
MTAKGLRKCRAVHRGENQKPVSHRSPRALGNRCRDSHIPAAPATTAMGKGKSKSRIPTFPQRLPWPCQINQKRKEINPSPKPCPSGSSQDWNVLPCAKSARPERTCTSIVERSNLSLRMGTRRCARLTNAFSKKWENRWAAMSLWCTSYNFCPIHKIASGYARDGGGDFGSGAGCAGPVGLISSKRGLWRQGQNGLCEVVAIDVVVYFKCAVIKKDIRQNDSPAVIFNQSVFHDKIIQLFYGRSCLKVR